MEDWIEMEKERGADRLDHAIAVIEGAGPDIARTADNNDDRKNSRGAASFNR